VQNVFAQTESRPNFIIIMADDLGYGDISAFGSDSLLDPPVYTPNIDSLIAQGLCFNDFHSNGAVCSPTRAALLTGRYQQRAGMEEVIYVGERDLGMAPAEVTFAEVLKEAGYATGIVGKWHLGFKPEFNPVNQGFDLFHGFTSGNVDYISHVDNAGYYDWWHNLDTLTEEGYSTDLISRHAVDFIQENKDVPFCLYIAHAAPHTPFQGRNDSADRIAGETGHPYAGTRQDIENAYKEMIEAMDEGTGLVMDKVKELQLEENTLVFFFSDNGPYGPGQAGVLRGKKSSLWEGGHRVPAGAWWPGRIEAGRVSDETVITMDIFPTIAVLAGVSISGLDGIDISPLLLDNQPLGERTLVWRYGRSNQVTIRTGPWKLMINTNNQDTSLFNLDDDIRESNNLAGSRVGRKNDLAAALAAWESDLAVEKPVTFEVKTVRHNGYAHDMLFWQFGESVTIYFNDREVHTVSVRNIGGKLVLLRDVSDNGSLSFSTSGWRPGVYVLKTNMGNYHRIFI